MKKSVHVILAVLFLIAPAFARDLGTMSADEIKLLQQRLTDAQCYKGPIDGLPSGATKDAVKACPDQAPVLRIETGMHTAVIKAMDVDRACTVMATASDDKTVRLWSLPDGKLKQVLRLPIGDGYEGQAVAVALSPGGDLLAAGGWDASNSKIGTNGLYLYDLKLGTVRHVGVFPNVTNILRFSRDGRRLGVGLGSNGIRVLDPATGQEIFAAKTYGGTVYGLAFLADDSTLSSRGC